MTTLHRLIFFVSLMFWQGGLMFYGSVVITVGAQVLGSELEQGFVTQAVSNHLNLAGAVCLTIWGIVLWRERTTWLGWTLWLILVVSLGALAVLHGRMDQRLEFESHAVTGHGFYSLHRTYLAISTAQWLATLTLLGLTMHGCRQADRPDEARRILIGFEGVELQSFVGINYFEKPWSLVPSGAGLSGRGSVS